MRQAACWTITVAAALLLSPSAEALSRVRTGLQRTVVRRALHRGRSLQMNVWSNPQAVEDYQNLLNGIVPENKEDQASCIVVGKDAELGRFLAKINPREDDVVIDASHVQGILNIPDKLARREGDPLEEFPIYLCVSCNELAAVLDACPEHKREDLVILSDGFVEPLLKSRGLCGKDQTQCTLWFKLNQYGIPFDGRVNMGPNANGIDDFAGETTVTGKWGGAIKERLERQNLFCRTMFYRDWRRVMMERVIYLATFNLVGILHPTDKGPCDHDGVAKYFSQEVDDMIYELGRTLRGHMALTLLTGTTERLCAYAEAHGKGVFAEMPEDQFRWRSGLFWGLSNDAVEKGFGDTCEMHTEYLQYGDHEGYFKIPSVNATP